MQKIARFLLIFAVCSLQICKVYPQASVAIFLARTYEYEGGASFTDTKFDGHYTKFGVILPTLEKWHRETGGGDYDGDKKVTWNDIRLLTWAEATKIYKRFYWDRVQADSIQSQRLANIIVDFVVNSGFRSDFIMYLQKRVGVKADGIIGAVTVKAINRANECDLFNDLLRWRIAYYKRVTKSTPRISKYYRGLINRLKKICCKDNYKQNEKGVFIIIDLGCDCLRIDELSK